VNKVFRRCLKVATDGAVNDDDVGRQIVPHSRFGSSVVLTNVRVVDVRLTLVRKIILLIDGVYAIVKVLSNWE